MTASAPVRAEGSAPSGWKQDPLRLLRLGRRPTAVLAVASLAGLATFCWPLLIQPPDAYSGSGAAPVIFLAVLPVLVVVMLAEITSGGLDAKALAMLGVLAAVGAALRPLGAGTAGLETVFFLLILGGRVFGPGFGFVLGSTTLFASALITAGVGPWLPYQMLAASWVGLGAGLLPWSRLRGRWEIVLLAAYGVVAAYAYGFLMNLSSWPYATGSSTELSYVAGAPLLENLHTFVVYTVATSMLGWDTGRAITNVVVICLVGPAVLAALRRASRRAAFGAPVEFDAAEPSRPRWVTSSGQ